MKHLYKLIMLASLASMSACSTMSSVKQSFNDMRRIETVKPWQKNILAKDEMQLSGNPIESYFDSHIYFSKEASTGGYGVGGGGCGCN